MSDDAALWDERYRESDRIWTREPNPTLVELAGPLEPGTALDVGCGEGGDARWLAAHGWSVMGTDISRVAIDRARQEAAADDIDIEWRQADLVTDPLEETFDLVTVHYMHIPPEPRMQMFRRLVEAVAPGGHLLIVGHHPSDMTSGAHRPPDISFFWTADDLTPLLDETWTVKSTETRPRTKERDGQEILVNDAVLLAQRDG